MLVMYCIWVSILPKRNVWMTDICCCLICSSWRVQVRIMLSVLQFRLNRRYVEADPPFVAIELDQSDSGREGCAVSTLTITSEPKDWRGAIQVCSRPFLRRIPLCDSFCKPLRGALGGH